MVLMAWLFLLLSNVYRYETCNYKIKFSQGTTVHINSSLILLLLHKKKKEDGTIVTEVFFTEICMK